MARARMPRVEGSGVGVAVGSAKRKSSMATMSSVGFPRTPSERMVLTPEVMRTRAICSPLLATAPRKDCPWVAAVRQSLE